MDTDKIDNYKSESGHFIPCMCGNVSKDYSVDFDFNIVTCNNCGRETKILKANE